MTFYVNLKNIGDFNLTGVGASHTATFSRAGSDTITAVYSGDTNFKANTTTLTQTVNNAAGANAVSATVAAVDHVLGTLQDESSIGSPINDVALELVATQSRRQRVLTTV